MNLVLNVNALNGLDMRKLSTYIHLSRTTLAQLPNGSMIESLSLESNDNFLQVAGKQHYRMLAYISSVFSHIQIADIGTSSGGSAMALASNLLNRIYSLDRVNCRTKDYLAVTNASFNVGNFDDVQIFSKILKSSVILLDIQHEGPDEIRFVSMLNKANWNGILICDDITLNDAMRNFWAGIDRPKYDVTKYGHGDNGSGTGIVLFGSEHTITLE